MPVPKKEAQEQRLRFFAEAAHFTPMLAVDGEGCRFLVETRDKGVGRTLFTKGARREFVTLERAASIARTHMRGPETFIDVGANIGTTVVTALRACDFTAAVACEPEPRNYRLLRTNLVLNGVDDRTQTFPVAISDRVGQVDLVLHPENGGAHRVLTERGRRPSETESEEITVDAVTLDLLVERATIDPADVGLVWIDVQGHETQVLAGATALREAGAPVVLEFHPGLLRAADGLDRLRDVIADGYSDYVDLRGRDLGLQPLEQLDALAESLSARRSHTDLLLVRRATPRNRR